MKVSYFSDGSLLISFSHTDHPDVIVHHSDVPGVLASLSSDEDEGARHIAEGITKSLREYGLLQEPTAA